MEILLLKTCYTLLLKKHQNVTSRYQHKNKPTLISCIMQEDDLINPFQFPYIKRDFMLWKIKLKNASTNNTTLTLSKEKHT